MPREKVELASKLLEVGSRLFRVLVYRTSSILIYLLLQEALGREGGRSQDETELFQSKKDLSIAYTM